MALFARSPDSLFLCIHKMTRLAHYCQRANTDTCKKHQQFPREIANFTKMDATTGSAALQQEQKPEHRSVKRKPGMDAEIGALTTGIKKMRIHESNPKSAWELLEEMKWDEKKGKLYGEWKSKRGYTMQYLPENLPPTPPRLRSTASLLLAMCSSTRRRFVFPSGHRLPIRPSPLIGRSELCTGLDEVPRTDQWV